MHACACHQFCEQIEYIIRKKYPIIVHIRPIIHFRVYKISSLKCTYILLHLQRNVAVNHFTHADSQFLPLIYLIIYNKQFYIYIYIYIYLIF